MTITAINHTFHVPVMGVAFTIDSPIKLAPFGISSVISMVDDTFLEQMRAYYAKQFNMAYDEISNKVADFRAKRVTSYLNLVQEIVQLKLENIKNAAWEKGSELEKYFKLLPNSSQLKKEFMARLSLQGMDQSLRNWVQTHLLAGDIDINIMTKLDRENEYQGERLPHEYNDAHSALRGFAQSNLSSSVVLSAGLNPRLYTYFEQFKDFYPDASGRLKKRIILKISDYRSALIQGKFLAKKGLWVSEFRMESGLNCGGHAFATDGLLMGPILEEFKQHRVELKETLFKLYAAALKEKDIPLPVNAFEQKFTAQGGLGTADEHQLLLAQYQLDALGWGSTFLLVPEATTVDDATLQQLCEARESDFYLSHNSPLGVRFNNIKNNSMAYAKELLIQKNRPGSSCPKKYSVLNKEYTEKPICTASRQYQNLRLQDLKTKGLSDKAFQKEFELTTTRECLCVGLTNAALLRYNIPTKYYDGAVSICPGPNLAYFNQLISLQDMVDHIYGRKDILTRKDRPHMFVKELQLYIAFFKEAVSESEQPLSKQRTNYLQTFEKNLQEGIAYYKQFFAANNLPSALAEIKECEEAYFSV